MKNRHQRNKEKDLQARLKIAHRKKFFANLKMVCNLYAGYDLFSKLPPFCLERIYAVRLRGLILLPTEGTVAPPEVLKQMTEWLKIMMDLFIIELPNERGKIPLKVQLEEGFSLTLQIDKVKDEGNAAVQEAKEVLSYYKENEYFGLVLGKVYELMNAMAVLFTNLDSGLAQFTHTFKLIHDVKNVFYMRHIEPTRKHFVVEGHARPAVRIGWAYSNLLDWADIKPSQLGLSSNNDEPMPVFIQSHALMRLTERMGLTIGMMHFAAFHSIKQCQYHRDERGRILIAYNYFNKKTGYLVCSVEQDCVLVHTFLFLTNNGTPEGKKLFDLTGLQIMDKKYLAIDRLETLLSYSIEENELVKTIFMQADCGHLFSLKKEFIGERHTNSATIIADYLTKNLNFKSPPLVNIT
jgi:hypothetical protein